MRTQTQNIVLHHCGSPQTGTQLTQYYTEVAGRITKGPPTIAPEKTGLYVLTPTAGIQDSVDFWRSALEVGPGLVSPASFPWTLANGPASCLGRLLKAKGPNITLVGDTSQTTALLQLAEQDLQNGVIEWGVCVVIEEVSAS